MAGVERVARARKRIWKPVLTSLGSCRRAWRKVGTHCFVQHLGFKWGLDDERICNV